jgi:hypothetical protein
MHVLANHYEQYSSKDITETCEEPDQDQEVDTDLDTQIMPSPSDIVTPVEVVTEETIAGKLIQINTMCLML